MHTHRCFSPPCSRVFLICMALVEQMQSKPQGNKVSTIPPAVLVLVGVCVCVRVQACMLTCLCFRETECRLNLSCV